MDLYRQLFSESFTQREWHMVYGERVGLLYLLNKIRPDVSIEIGTFKGGSLSPIAHFSNHVYTIDINAAAKKELSPSFNNVSFISGDSREVFPDLIKKINKSGENVEFILVDGDHTTDGVSRDISSCLQIRPTSTRYVVMHDSFNPDVRKGIVSAGWEACEFVHHVELDFVHGAFHQNPNVHRQMWGGLALAVIQPVPRNGELQISASQNLAFEVVLENSVHAHDFSLC